jgi:hypothetical protein
MDCKLTKQLLQLIAHSAAIAQAAIDNGDNNCCFEECDNIMINVERVMRELETLNS